jgi:hypothetical protein
MTIYDNNLQAIFANHTQKLSDKWSIYLSEYDRLFLEYRDRELNLLEIGVSHGGSLEIWSKYFANAKNLIGCDINTNCARLSYVEPNITIVVGDANTDTTHKEILSNATNFDLIIDDGSHRSGDMITTFSLYFAHLVEGGLYVVEDLHCSYWEGWQGGLLLAQSSIEFFKCIADIVNHEHWGTGESRCALLNKFELIYNIKFDEEVLSQIHSVEFINSMCVIRKAAPQSNTLGARLLAGKIPLVDEIAQTTIVDSDSTSKIKLSQTSTPPPTYEEIYSEMSMVRAELKSVYRSRSWRWTRPMRSILALFK